MPDYNGHYGIRELCGIPVTQRDLCRGAHRVPFAEQIHDAADGLPDVAALRVVDFTERAAVVAGFSDERPRYYLQQALGFQVHDARHPHRPHRHGRANIAGRRHFRDD